MSVSITKPALFAALCLMAATQPSSAREASEYMASKARILECVETAERFRIQTRIALARECIGRETQNCLDLTELGHASEQRMFCAAAEAVAWESIREEAYSTLLKQVAKEDEGKSAEYHSALPALKRAHEAWQRTFAEDCDFARLRPGMGTDRMDAPARCARDAYAERALLYRNWLRGITY